MLDCEVHLFAPLRTTAARTVEETVGTTSRSILRGHETPLKLALRSAPLLSVYS